MGFQSSFYVLVGLCVHVAWGFYSPSSGVVDLTPSNFESQVINSDEIWVVEFYAPWCGHCKRLVPEYTKLAKALKGLVKVGAVNADDHKSLGGQYSVQGFPTIKIFGRDKKKPEDYSGSRNAQGVIDAVKKVIKAKITDQLNGKSSGGGSGSGSSSGGGSSGGGSTEDVVVLTDGNFEKLVVDSDEMWLVEFFAPWCGHCKNLEPEWKSAASQLRGQVKLGALDATINTVKGSQYNVKGYPTIKFFHKGEVEDYNGGRTASDIVSWAKDKLTVTVPAPEIHQILSNDELQVACKEHPICIITVFPHILDCQSDCRNKHIAMLLKLGDRYKQKLWGWVWAEAMAHPELEESLEIGGFGYPALAALNAKKMQFALLRGSFSPEGVNEFLRDISYGRGRTAPLRGAKLPELKKVEAWDGKDGELPVEEEYDLSDVDLDKDEL